MKGQRSGNRRANALLAIAVAVLIYPLSYVGARKCLGLVTTPSAAGTKGTMEVANFRFFLPDGVLSGMDVIFFPLRQADENMTGQKVQFTRIRSKMPSGSTIEL